MESLCENGRKWSEIAPSTDMNWLNPRDGGNDAWAFIEYNSPWWCIIDYIKRENHRQLVFIANGIFLFNQMNKKGEMNHPLFFLFHPRAKSKCWKRSRWSWCESLWRRRIYLYLSHNQIGQVYLLYRSSAIPILSRTYFDDNKSLDWIRFYIYFFYIFPVCSLPSPPTCKAVTFLFSSLRRPLYFFRYIYSFCVECDRHFLLFSSRERGEILFFYWRIM